MNATSYHDPIPTWAKKSRVQDVTHNFVDKNRLQPGFSILEFVQSLGGEISYKSYGINQKGNESIVIDGPGCFQIYLPSDTSPLRDRFTMAHELGHYLLHYPLVREKHGEDAGMKANRFVEKSQKDLNRAEWEANWFAASLLMPRTPFEDMWRKYRSAEVVGNVFEVTPHAARIRAQSLGLVD